MAYKPLSLDDKMPFGKYDGKPIWWVLDNDRDYLNWCVDGVDGFELDNEAFAALERATDAEAKRLLTQHLKR